MSSWARIDGQMAFHPKILVAGNEAVGAWARMIAYATARRCGSGLTAAEALTFAPKRTIDQLTAAGLLDPDGDGYRIHDYEQWNPILDRKLSTARAEAGRRGAARRWRPPDGKPDGKRDGKLPSTLPSVLPSDPWQTDSKPDGKRDGNLPSGLPSGGRALEGGLGGGLPLVPSENQTRSQSSDLPDREGDPGHTRAARARGNGKPKSSPPGTPGEPRRALPRETSSGTFLKSSESREGERERDGEPTSSLTARPVGGGLPAPIADDEHRARAAAQLAALERWAADGGETK